MIRTTLLVAGAVLWIATPARADVGAEAAVLQAEGVLHEIDGDLDGALGLLREALALTPEDPNIAFDLARVAMAGEAPAAEDLTPFLAVTPQSDGERKLRAYILAERGELEQAIAALGPEAEADPAIETAAGTDQEMAELRQTLTDARAAETQGPDRLNLWLNLSGQVDSNVNLDNSLPPSDRVGARTMISGGLTTAPFESLPGLQGALTLELGVHLNNRQDLAVYDTLSGVGQISFGTDLGPLALYSEGYLNHLRARTGAVPFMSEGGALAELRWPWTVTPGIYADASFRDFDIGNEGTDALAQASNRDGPRVAVGLLGEWLYDDFGLSGRVGFQTEHAKGQLQRQRGFDVNLTAFWQVWRLELVAGFGIEWRGYPDIPDDPVILAALGFSDNRRTDLRLMPQFDARLAITDWLGMRAGYFMVRNLSRNAADYTRHVATLGVEGRY